jgi:PAS domain S-box-containing protein
MRTEQVSQLLFHDIQTISNTKLLSVIDEMLEGVQIFDKNLNYLFINKAAEKQNQRPKEDLLGKSYETSWPGIENKEVYKLIRQSMDEQKIIQFEYEFEFLDGSKGWFYLSVQPIDEGILILSLDITSRMILGQEIENSQRLYHSLFENLLNGFAYCKMEYRDGLPIDYYYLTVNNAFKQLTGLKNVVGKKASEVVPGIQQSDPILFITYGRVAETGNAETFEVFIKALQMWFFINVYSPEKGYFVTIFEAITERKNAEKKINDQLEELQRWYEVTIDREQRSIELKKEINHLLLELGKTPKYPIANKSQDE